MFVKPHAKTQRRKENLSQLCGLASLREKKSFVPPIFPAVFRHDAAQAINIRIRQFVAVFLQILPRIPLRADELAGDAGAFRAGEIDGEARAEFQRHRAFFLPALVLLEKCRADFVRAGGENFIQFERMVLLQSIDTHWREHLSSLDYLRQGIHLRGYAQKQPKQEYKREAFELFGQLLDSVKNDVTKVLMTVKIQSNEQLEQAAEDMENRGESIANVTYSAPTETGEVETVVDEETVNKRVAAFGGTVPRVGRNESCPCGSGKKYKHCHGKLA